MPKHKYSRLKCFNSPQTFSVKSKKIIKTYCRVFDTAVSVGQNYDDLDLIIDVSFHFVGKKNIHSRICQSSFVKQGSPYYVKGDTDKFCSNVYVYVPKKFRIKNKLRAFLKVVYVK